MAKRVVVTGGLGFIGRHLTNHHASKGDDVVVIDNMSTSVPGTGSVKYNSLHVADLVYESHECLRDMFDGADIIYHMASSVGVKHVDKDPQHAIRNILRMNSKLFPALHGNKAKVIFASTSEVYGNTTEAKESDNLSIGPPTKLRWGYACSKLMSEFMIKCHDINNVVVRFFNVTGNGQIGDHGMVLPTFIKQAKENKDIIVHGDGRQYRSFCDIRDAVNMLDILSGDTSHIDNIYNIGNPENTITILELAHRVINITGSNSSIIMKDYDKCFSDQFADIYERKPNIDKMSAYYECQYGIDDIIESML